MSSRLEGPFFEIGPKNLLRRSELEALVLAAGAAGADYGVTVIVTVPTALIAPTVDLGAEVRVFAQGMSAELPGPSMGTVIAESLIDAGAAGVMLNHDSNPLDDSTLARTVTRAHEVGLDTIVCAASTTASIRFAALAPTAILYEPPELIGTAGASPRDWIAGSNFEVQQSHPQVLMMHAGGVGTPEVARTIMVAGADGTGSTSGVLNAEDPTDAARQFIAAVRNGWDEFRSRSNSEPTLKKEKEHEN